MKTCSHCYNCPDSAVCIEVPYHDSAMISPWSHWDHNLTISQYSKKLISGNHITQLLTLSFSFVICLKQDAWLARLGALFVEKIEFSYLQLDVRSQLGVGQTAGLILIITLLDGLEISVLQIKIFKLLQTMFYIWPIELIIIISNEMFYNEAMNDI